MEIRTPQNNISTTDNQASSAYDVVIIGGGPAGSTVATLLTRWGRRVLLLEKEYFPRHHIGESLLAGTVTLMKRLGVLEKVERSGFVHKYGATYIWGKATEPWSIFFSEVSGEDRYSFQVERAKFDKLLLDHSREAGTTVMEGCRVTEFLRDGERIVGVKYIGDQQIPQTVTCQFCVDASGQSALLGNAMKLRRFNPTLRNFALYAYFQGGKSAVDLIPDLQDKDRGNIFVVAIEKGWIWYIPLGRDRYSVGVVTHASLARELSKAKRFAFYQDCLKMAPQIQYLLSAAKIESTTLYSQSDWSYVCDSFKGPGYLLVGDAACFVDPILSTGVDLAMEGAFKAALSINTALNEPDLTEQAMQWYEKEYKTKAGHFLHMAEHWYHGHRNRDDWFWKAKQLVDPNSNLSIRQAFILLTGGFTTGAGDEDLPALQPFGGFRPFQLRTIYTNLDTKAMVTDEPITLLTKPATDRPSHNGSTPKKLIENLEEWQPRFKKNMSYHLSMLEQEDQLVPVVHIVQDIEGVLFTRLVLPSTSTSLLERIDGERTAQEIIEEFSIVECNGTNYDQNDLYSVLHELYKQNIIDVV